MSATARYLHFANLDMEQPDINAQCSVCGQEFKAEVRQDERIDDVLMRIRAAYNHHKCESIH